MQHIQAYGQVVPIVNIMYSLVLRKVVIKVMLNVKKLSNNIVKIKYLKIVVFMIQNFEANCSQSVFA